jgi:hypothetical protein
MDISLLKVYPTDCAYNKKATLGLNYLTPSLATCAYSDTLYLYLYQYKYQNLYLYLCLHLCSHTRPYTCLPWARARAGAAAGVGWGGGVGWGEEGGTLNTAFALPPCACQFRTGTGLVDLLHEGESDQGAW